VALLCRAFSIIYSSDVRLSGKQEWYSSGGDKATFTSVSSGGGGAGGGAAAPRKLIADIETEGLGTDTKPSYFQLKCTIAYCSATADAGPEGKKRAW